MKKAFRFILLELAFLRRTIITIGLILTVFSAAFLSVVSVMIDVQQGLYDFLDDRWCHVECLVDNVPINQALQHGGLVAYAEVDGYSSNTELLFTDSEGNFKGTYSTELTLKYGESEQSISTYGYGVLPKDCEQLFAAYDTCLMSGRWISGPDEIVLSPTIYSNAKHGLFTDFVMVGDKVTIGDRTFTVVGLYMLGKAIGYDSFNEVFLEKPEVETILKPAYYFFSLNGDEMAKVAHIACSNAEMLNSVYLRYTRNNFTANSAGVSIKFKSYHNKDVLENLDLTNAFFLAIAFVLGVIIVFILYSLMSIFYRQRKVNICRMKLLGARNSLITMVYTLIAVALVFFAVAVGSALSMMFNVYYLNLCKDVFGYENFVSHFYPVIPLCLFVVLTACIFVIYIRFYRRIRGASLAQEVRSE